MIAINHEAKDFPGARGYIDTIEDKSDHLITTIVDCACSRVWIELRFGDRVEVGREEPHLSRIKREADSFLPVRGGNRAQEHFGHVHVPYQEQLRNKSMIIPQRWCLNGAVLIKS